MTKKTLHRPYHTAPTGPASDRTLRRVASGVFGLTVVLAIASLVTANNLATTGRTSQEMEIEIENLIAENSRLTVENTELTSITRIYAVAKEAGFITPSKLEKVRPTPPVALKDR